MITREELMQRIVENFSQLPLHTVTLMGLSFILGGAFALLALLLLEHVRRGHQLPGEEE